MASTPKFFDRVMASSTTTGTGTYTLSGTPVTGYQAFSAVGDGNSCYYCAMAVDGDGNPSGDWEVNLGTYTSAGTTLSRDTLLASSTGAAINWAAGTRRLFLVAPAAYQTYGGLINQTGPTNGDQTMQVGALYVTDISGYSADRTYTLPATAAVGDRCGIMLSAGDDAFELLITAAAGDTLIGSRGSVAGGSEYTRLFITGEVMIFRCTVANATWVVEHDGRIPVQVLMRLSTDAASSETAATNTVPTAISGVFTADVDRGACASTSNSRFNVRRSGNYSVWCRSTTVANLTDTNYHYSALCIDDTTTIACIGIGYASGTNSTQAPTGTQSPVALSAGSFLQYVFASQQGSRGLDSSAAPRILSGFGVIELLP